MAKGNTNQNNNNNNELIIVKDSEPKNIFIPQI